ncbi:MAG: hypothetical protein GC203_06460 [Phenylobacterium sp.]|uniref:hypothetical protein n=1 Tax=Phenylobacterium sp. TaxID=1871053 RepID=UPI0025D3797C|nr:hypothetical protein [Phenylobacterium sp.]MBI1197487.1 hypothetical protein [Phenylobacterium sp.]
MITPSGGPATPRPRRIVPLSSRKRIAAVSSTAQAPASPRKKAISSRWSSGRAGDSSSRSLAPRRLAFTDRTDSASDGASTSTSAKPTSRSTPSCVTATASASMAMGPFKASASQARTSIRGGDSNMPSRWPPAVTPS